MIRETIIRKIVEWDLAGHSLLENQVQAKDELFHAAAINEFGSWETALQYAGVSVHEVGRSRILSLERTKQQLRRLCTTGYDLGAIVNRNRNRSLYYSALHHFGSWRAALKEAGINLTNVTYRRPKHLDRDGMILWLRNRRDSGQSMMFRDVCLENRDYAFAIRREFGSWKKAIAATDVQFDK